MAVKLRLMRMGKTKQPTYRVVAADSRSPRDGRFIEIVGSYTAREARTRSSSRPTGWPVGSKRAPSPRTGYGASWPQRGWWSRS